MNLSRVALLLLSLCTLLLAPITSFAETSKEVNAKVETYKSSISKKRDALDTAENRLQSYEAKKADAMSQLIKAKTDLLDAKRELKEAEAAKGDDAATKLDLAQRRVELAERGVQSRESRLSRIQDKYKELSDEQEKLSSEIKWLNGQIAPLTKRASELAEKEKAAAIAAASKPAPTPVPTPQPTPIAVATPTPTPEPMETLESVPDNVIAETPETALSKATPEPEQAAAPAESLTPHQRYARSEMRKLNEKTKNADKTEHRRFTELLMEVDRDETIELEYLGNGQFYGEVPLVKGKHTLTVDLRKFVVKIPPAANKDVFVIIYDTSEQDNERFVLFNKNLLD